MIHEYPYETALTTALANFIVRAIQTTLKIQDRFTLVLSGGNTPKMLYHKLASPAWASAIPWEKIHIFWGDERYVPHDDERNNAKMAFDTLLNKVKIPPFNIHRMRTDIPIAESVKEYEKTLHTYFTFHKTFDLVLLGLGEDGHTLSLFPGSKVLDDKRSWVCAVEDVDPKRVTLMPEVVNASSLIVFLVMGKEKSEILRRVTEGYDAAEYPAQMITPDERSLHWFVTPQLTPVNSTLPPNSPSNS